MFTAASLFRSPNALAPHYSRFRVAERLLLTGHSHQAWPDAGFEGHEAAWLDAAALVDDKWEAAFARADRVRAGFARLLDDVDGEIALGANTHELLVRFLSALPLRRRPRIVTTDGEYHSLRRQLDRLAEEGLEIVKVRAEPAAEVTGRLAAAVDERTSAVMASAIFYRNAHIARGWDAVAEACRRAGAELLVDVYHALNVVPFSIRQEGLAGAFVTGGGYKYCQLGEGNAFLRFPRDTRLRPAVTGWYSEFGTIAATKDDAPFAYGAGAGRFAGATYDPTSHYRAAAVFDFFDRHGLTPAFLREVNAHQVAHLARRFDALDADPALITRDRSVGLDAVGGFLALRSPEAAVLCEALHARGVMTDHRAGMLRFGPAPYLADAQLDAAMDALAEVLRAIAGRSR